MKRPGSRVTIVSVLLLGAIIFGMVYYAWNTVLDVFQPVDGSKNARLVTVEVKSGETTVQIADKLEEQKLIRSAVAFRLWARIKGYDRNLEAGVYKKLATNMTISEIVDQLQNGQPDATRVTIPEGYRVEQIAYTFANANPKLMKFKESEFLNYAKHPDQFPDAGKYPFLQQLKQQDRIQTMEGLLFPDSYVVPLDADAKVAMGMMLKEMQENIQQNHLDQLAQQHSMTLYQLLTLSSIVQREARFIDDMPNIASVYWNRVYKSGNETAGFLQADPTVQYGRDNTNPPAAGGYWKPLEDAGKNVAVDSPWNTYINKGLPPTPICSPGLDSLRFAAAPPRTDYLYFFAKKDGHSVFAKTLDEFELLKTKYPVSGN